MASALQTLLSTAGLRRQVRDVAQACRAGGRQACAGVASAAALVAAWAALQEQCVQARGSAVAPTAFKAALGAHCSTFKGYHQHDSHEAVLACLGALEDVGGAVARWLPGGTFTPCTQGSMRSTLACPLCKHTSSTSSTFQTLTVTLLGGAAQCRLSDCVAATLGDKVLDIGEEWRCSGCNKAVQATLSTCIVAPPAVLFVHLSRFEQRVQVHQQVGAAAPPQVQRHSAVVTWDVNGFTLPLQGTPKAAQYSTTAVSNHHGGLGGGHYTAAVRAPGSAGSGWAAANDSSVQPLNTDASLQSAANYLLCMEKQQ